MNSFDAVFSELRSILVPYAKLLNVRTDNEIEYSLDTWHVQKNKTYLFFAAVKRRKADVGFHLMPVYVTPRLLDSISPGLKTRMQGKSCFNFAKGGDALFMELSSLTAKGFESFREQGFIGIPASGQS
jgi:hypothetical protein